MGSAISVEDNNRKDEGWSIEEYGIAPLGIPKRPTENVTENAISKIASIKSTEHQLSETETSILWLDFQDETWNLLATPERVWPVRTWNGGFYSGEFWYAFYGWKNAPIFENFRLDMFSGEGKLLMRHDGRFRKTSKLDAVVISLPRNTIVLENPFSQKPVKSIIWQHLVFLPWFNFEYSCMNWPMPTLNKKIELQVQNLDALSQSSIA